MKTHVLWKKKEPTFKVKILSTTLALKIASAIFGKFGGLERLEMLSQVFVSVSSLKRTSHYSFALFDWTFLLLSAQP